LRAFNFSNELINALVFWVHVAFPLFTGLAVAFKLFFNYGRRAHDLIEQLIKRLHLLFVLRKLLVLVPLLLRLGLGFPILPVLSILLKQLAVSDDGIFSERIEIVKPLLLGSQVAPPPLLELEIDNHRLNLELGQSFVNLNQDVYDKETSSQAKNNPAYHEPSVAVGYKVSEAKAECNRCQSSPLVYELGRVDHGVHEGFHMSYKNGDP
jgi:hypothetical protein